MGGVGLVMHHYSTDHLRGLSVPTELNSQTTPALFIDHLEECNGLPANINFSIGMINFLLLLFLDRYEAFLWNPA